jgi:hypothetical protein
MSDLDLLVPAISIVALFGVIGLVVQSIRQGRAIRRVEELLRESGAGASEASLDRIRQLQTRASISSGVRRGTGPAITIAALLAVAVLAGGAWFLLSNGGSDDGGAQQAQAGEAAGGEGNGQQDSPGSTEPAEGETTPGGDDGDDAGATDEAPPPTGRVPADIPPLANKAEVTVAIFNASGVQGAAGTKTRGILEAEGYSFGNIDNSPDGRSDLAQTVVMWPEGNEEIAWNVARDLDVELTPPLDGLTPEQIGSADVVVIVGLDVANRP